MQNGFIPSTAFEASSGTRSQTLHCWMEQLEVQCLSLIWQVAETTCYLPDHMEALLTELKSQKVMTTTAHQHKLFKALGWNSETSYVLKGFVISTIIIIKIVIFYLKCKQFKVTTRGCFMGNKLTKYMQPVAPLSGSSDDCSLICHTSLDLRQVAGVLSGLSCSLCSCKQPWRSSLCYWTISEENISCMKFITR